MSYRLISACDLVVGDEDRRGRKVVEFLEAKSSQFIKVRLSDGVVKTHDKGETLILKGAL